MIKNSEQKTPKPPLRREWRKGGFGVRRNVIKCVLKDAKRNKEMERIYSIDELRCILSPVFARYGVKSAILFGSYGNGCATEKSDVVNELKSEVEDMRMQIHILKETINVLKKDPGVDQAVLRNREKAAIIGALKSKYSLPNLLAALHCPRSSYYYQQKTVKRQVVAKKKRVYSSLSRGDYAGSAKCHAAQLPC